MIDRLRENLTAVHQRIREAECRSGRAPDSVRLVAVTKYVDAATTAALVAAGCHELGENRPQSLWGKSAELANQSIQWHLIGHLQRNKVKRTVEIATLIHSVDSVRLLEAIESASNDLNRTAHVLLEVNVSGEPAKHGFAGSELPLAIEHVAKLSHVQVEGLMCMAGLEGSPDEVRREFDELARLADFHRTNVPSNVSLKELSMGMSGDFEIAIAAGSTIVRVGSLLLEGIR